MSQLTEIKVPDLGIDQPVPVTEILVKVGDRVSEEQALLTLESDKATMDIPSPMAGEIKEIKVKIGDKITQGQVIFSIETSDVSANVSNEAQQKPSEGAQAEVSSKDQQLIEVKIPDIGGATDVPVIDVLVKAGERVTLEQPLITLESDKATMDVPSPAEGVVESVKIKVGDRVSTNSVVLLLKAEKSVKSAAAKVAASVSETSVARMETADFSGKPVSKVNEPAKLNTLNDFNQEGSAEIEFSHASPSVRQFARELGVQVANIAGTGPKNRITREDVVAYVKAKMSSKEAASVSGQGSGFDVLPWPKVDFAKFGPFKGEPLSRIKKISGANLHRNWVMIPHVTNNDEADITELEALRVKLNQEHQKQGIKFTMLAFVIKAVVAGLKKFPNFNASLDGEQLIYKQYYHIGFAADTPNGLVVPVIRDADQKSLTEIAKEMASLSQLAREGKLKPDQMQGGCFSISSLGGIGGTNFTPIINAPEVAILGLSRSVMKPVWNGEQFIPRLMLPLSLSYDHRVIDGAEAARFNVYLSTVLADLRRILL